MTIVWAGLAVGAVYAIVALTMNLPLAQSGVFNIAQGQILVLGLYLSYAGLVTFDLPWPVVIVGSALICGAFALVEDFVAIRPLVGDENHGTLVTTIGALTIIQGVILVVWGPDPIGLEFFGGTEPFSLLGGRLVPVDLVVIILAIVLGLTLQVVSSRTRWGLSGRAATEDADAAKVRGINVPLLRVGSLTLAGAIAGAAAVVIAAKLSIANEAGLHLMIYGFVALIIGGVGSFGGSLVAGLAVGLVDSLSARYLGSQYSSVLIFAILMTVLLVKPSGVFGRASARLV
ncbi:branched-chain amino acid ABC transporter permease [Phytohabitans suffuscus]|uniref:Branched-chain amino acid ABC transporter permease n=1 Tax=Phytohabitans suffuscus TaxID=624315 RepID=A0A6F8YRD2_9ACTN|nr:branched-chain amino acid ABC transporter permease [Phytohabitans suffuscus]BCB88619.1 branched-chain amino acid ABC transporter permease [Phytohabitans suffuscus]